MYLATGHSLRIRVDAAATTTESTWYVGVKEKISTGIGDLVAARGLTTGTSNANMVAAIASGEQAEVVYAEVINADTVSHTYTIEFFNGTNAGPSKTFVLGVGERLDYSRRNWTVYTPSGTVAASQFTIRLDEGATYTYVGEAVPGTAHAAASWRVKRITNADTTVVFADGNANFDNVWTNRASLSYA